MMCGFLLKKTSCIKLQKFVKTISKILLFIKLAYLILNEAKLNATN